MTRKFFALLLVLSLTLSLLPTFAGAAGYDKIVYAYATFNNIPTAETLDTIEEKINSVTRDLINVEVELRPIAIWDYESTVSLGLQGGEQIDIFQTLGNLNTSIATDMCYPITDLIPTCAPEAAELVTSAWLDACSYQGEIYGIPTLKPIALTPMVIYRRDIAEELGLDMTAINSVFDLTDTLRAVKSAKPEMTPVAAVNSGNIGLQLTLENIDYLTDDYYSPKGVLMNDELKVIDFYATEQFKNVCNLARTWYNEGLVMRDAATTSSTAAELMSTGNYFCYIASYSYPEADTAASLEAQTNGYKLGAKIVGTAFLDTSSINALTWCVASTTKTPEAALKFLNLTFCNADVINTLIYGIEGRDYVLNEDGTMRYPDGFDSTTVPYTAQLSCGTLGNFFLMFPMEGTTAESLVWEQEQNRSAKTSVAMGFTYDNSRVKTAYTAVTNVIEQYLPALVCGSVDPEVDIPEFLQRLADAGLQTIIDSKQAQLDAWLAANGK